MAHVIRRALDRFLADNDIDPSRSLAASFGVLPDLAPPVRDEWDRG